MNNKLEKEAKLKEESRQIVKEIENFGINDSQKIDVMYFLCLTLNDNIALKEITKTLKKFKKNINNENSNNNIKKDKLILE